VDFATMKREGHPTRIVAVGWPLRLGIVRAVPARGW
jgi:hypothetical protein